MLDATERKTLAWCTFAAGVLCLIPGEQPHWPQAGHHASKIVNFAIQLVEMARQLIVMRVLEHRATQGAWGLCAILVGYHFWKTRKEEAAGKVAGKVAAEGETQAEPRVG